VIWKNQSGVSPPAGEEARALASLFGELGQLRVAFLDLNAAFLIAVVLAPWPSLTRLICDVARDSA
jgi:hypothetical protein